MATLDGGHRARGILPPINHLDLEKFKVQMNENNRHSHVHHSYPFSSAPLASPTIIYSGPPPPYSSASSVSGYISPPESTTRRSTRDDQIVSPSFRKSLPSIHEALSDKGVALSGPPAVASSSYGSAPPSAIGQSFPEGPRGPPNPFSAPAPPTLDTGAAAQSQSYPSSIPPPPPPPVTSQSFPPVASPRIPGPGSSLRHTALTNSAQNHHIDHPPTRPSPRDFEPARPTHAFPQYTPQPPPTPRPVEIYHFTAGHNSEDPRTTSAQPSNEGPYGDTVKRHLEMFDADMALHEINDASVQTLEFSRIWAQRHQQNSRSNYLGDALPSVLELDDMLRQAQRVMENLTQMRDMVLAQQAALTEQRARLARGIHHEEEYHHGMGEDYRNGGFPGSDAKKRRGKAAPPGRCHSCNRAETPEWRRGPDGARTLCNACGLHYAKLTRKMGANKAAALTGSNLRPKPLDQRP